jgi:hypothetical protein
MDMNSTDAQSSVAPSISEERQKSEYRYQQFRETFSSSPDGKRNTVGHSEGQTDFQKRRMSGNRACSSTSRFYEFFEEYREQILASMKKISRDSRINGVYRLMMGDEILREKIKEVGRSNAVLSNWLRVQPEVEVIVNSGELRFRLKGEKDRDVSLE